MVGLPMNVCCKSILTLSALLFVNFANAQAVHGVLRVVKGEVQIKSAKSGATARARIGEKVFPKDVVITGKDARAKIVMVDNNEINVSPESQIEIQHYEYDPAAGKKDVLLNVIYGKVRSKVEQKYDGKTSKFQIKTPSAVAGVRGTDFLTSYNKQNDSSQIVTFEGKVEFGIPGPNGAITGAVMVAPGQIASMSAGAPPSIPAAMPKEEFAKMEGETKADGPGAPAPNPTPGSGAKEGDKRQPANDGGNPPAQGEGNKEGARGPASDTKGGGGPMMRNTDTASGCGANCPPPPVPTMPTAPPVIPNLQTPTTVQDNIRDQLQNTNKKTNLIIKVN